jgi:ribosomal peptide maturation radical SAM protein 1
VPAIAEPSRPSTAEQRRAWPTVLVSMPFARADRPSIQLGLLAAVGQRHGYPVHTLHANLDFAALVGVDYFRLLAEQRGPLVGDWLFSVEAFGDGAPDRDGRLPSDFRADLTYLGPAQQARDRLLRTRDEVVPAYLDAVLESYPWHEVRVVGFSCTFQQTTASIALARRLKRRYPRIVTVFGGANFDGGMGLELLRGVDCIDFVVVGEGDTAFPLLLDALATGRDPAALPGVARRGGDRIVATPPAPPLERLDALPDPDYDEFFARAQEIGLFDRAGLTDVAIPFESARGCWWGVKHHCTFCGLNGSTLQFRSKSPRRVLSELANQVRRYHTFRFVAVDNILDMRYLTDLFPAIADTGADYELFYEVKANLTRDQIRVLARGGVTHIQPGIESLSSQVLRLMEKGSRAAQNINLLRWARYYGITVDWNVLWGFPGETADDYHSQAQMVPMLVHLPPPSSAGPVWLERFSPMYREPDRFRLRHRRPERSYGYVYPAGVDLDEIAYFFEYEPEDRLPDAVYDGLRHAVDAWQEAWRADHRPVLRYWSSPGQLQIYDGRWPERAGTYTFEGVLADIYLACADRPTTASAVRARLGLDLPVDTIEQIFGEFQRRGLLFRDESLALALALPAVPGR